jgi:AcrR family transcriptional regulator
MPKAFTEQEKERIGERLREQGHRLFAAYGVRKTRVEELARAAGISKGAFYLFYPSKEALFMDVVEQAEERFRQEVVAAIDWPGPSPRARLFSVLRRAFTLWKTIPILQVFTQGDYEWLSRRIPAEKLQEHLLSDRAFFEELIARCRQAGIPIQAPPEQMGGLLYAAFFTSLHEEDFGPGRLGGAVDLLLELIAAFCLGEITLQIYDPTHVFRSQPSEQKHESSD